jgi:transcriptional regulator with XRE-family HTH domain
MRSRDSSGRGEDVRPDIFRRQPGQASQPERVDIRDPAALPALNGGLRKAEDASQISATAYLLDHPARECGEVAGIAHATKSTNSSSGTQAKSTYRGRSDRTLICEVMKHPHRLASTMLTASDHQKAVGARLRRLATALGLRPVDLAREMGCSKQTVNSYFNGVVYPNDYGIYRLCRLHHINYDYLYLGDWSQLPAAVAAKLEPEFLRSLGDVPGSGPAGGENSGANTTSPRKSPRSRASTENADTE